MDGRIQRARKERGERDRGLAGRGDFIRAEHHRANGRTDGRDSPIGQVICIYYKWIFDARGKEGEERVRVTVSKIAKNTEYSYKLYVFFSEYTYRNIPYYDLETLTLAEQLNSFFSPQFFLDSKQMTVTVGMRRNERVRRGVKRELNACHANG